MKSARIRLVVRVPIAAANMQRINSVSAAEVPASRTRIGRRAIGVVSAVRKSTNRARSKIWRVVVPASPRTLPAAASPALAPVNRGPPRSA